MQDLAFRSFGGPAGGGSIPRFTAGIYVSRDGGESFERCDEGIPDEAMLHKMIITSQDSPVGKQLLAATSHGFFVSSDVGKSWEKRPAEARPYITAVDNDYAADKTLPHDTVLDMDVAYDAEGMPILLAVLQTQIRRSGDAWEFAGGLFRSDDLGRTWTDINGNLRFPLGDFSAHQAGILLGGSKPYLAHYLAYDELMADPQQRAAFAYDGYATDAAAHEAAMAKHRATVGTFDEAMREKIAAILESPELSERIEKTRGILGQFASVRVDPTDPDTIYIGNRSPTTKFFTRYPIGVWKTTDGGKTWVCITRKGHGWTRPGWTRYKPADEPPINMPDNRFAAIGDPNRPFPAGTGYTTFFHFDLSRSEPNVLICYALQKMYRSEDGGKSWAEASNRHFEDGRIIGKGNCNICVNGLALSSHSDDLFLACADKGVIYSADNGASLKQLLKDGGFVRTVMATAADPEVPGKYFFLEAERGKANRPELVFYKTLNNGKSFEHVKLTPRPFRETHTYIKAVPGIQLPYGDTEILVDPLSPPEKRTLFVSNSVGRDYLLAYAHGPARGKAAVFVSEDEGDSWRDISDGLEGSSYQPTTLAAAPDGTILLGLRQNLIGHYSDAPEVYPGGAWRLDRGTMSWKKIESLPLDDVRDLAFDPNDPKVIYASGGLGIERPFFDKVDPKWSRNGGLYRSEDGGATWTRLIDAPITTVVAVATWNPDVIYCLLPMNRGARDVPIMSAGIYRSTDRGATWQRASKGIATPNVVMDIQFRPQTPGEVWCITYGSGAYKGVDPDYAGK
jgi:hypothetical protein